jgi:hypothetical protein
MSTFQCKTHKISYPIDQQCPKCKEKRRVLKETRALRKTENRFMLKSYMSILTTLSEKIDILNSLLQQINIISPINNTLVLDGSALLDLPDHLRKTAKIVIAQGKVTAEMCSNITHRARAVESAYLNQLVIMNYCTKRRNGRKAFFEAIQR